MIEPHAVEFDRYENSDTDTDDSTLSDDSTLGAARQLRRLFRRLASARIRLSLFLLSGEAAFPGATLDLARESLGKGDISIGLNPTTTLILSLGPRPYPPDVHAGDQETTYRMVLKLRRKLQRWQARGIESGELSLAAVHKWSWEIDDPWPVLDHLRHSPSMRLDPEQPELRAVG